MKLALKIILLEFTTALVIVAATRAYVSGRYSLVVATEVVFVIQWFYSRQLSFDDEKSRSWLVGFPAYLIGGVAGAVAGLYLSKLYGG